MKILFITGSLNQGGAEYQILELAKLFQNNGNEVEVFAITDYDFYLPFIKENGLRYTHLYNHQSKVKRVYLTAKKIRELKPDLIISYLKRVSQVALFAKIWSGVKTKIIVGERTSDIQPYYDRYHFNLMRFADAITVNSLSKLRYLKQKFPKIEKKFVFFPNVIDIEKFGFNQKKYDRKVLKIGFVGRISPEKNIINLIKAIKPLVENKLSIILLVYGDSKNTTYKKSVERCIEENSLDKIIMLKGKSNNIKKVYDEIDLLCLISDYEGFSNVISEAMSSGLPIITSDIEENRFLIEDNINGFVVNHKNPQKIAEGIQKYFQLSRNAKHTMSLNNRKKAERMFNKEVVYDKYLSLINSL